MKEQMHVHFFLLMLSTVSFCDVPLPPSYLELKECLGVCYRQNWMNTHSPFPTEAPEPKIHGLSALD